jgi:hypothetical protein
MAEEKEEGKKDYREISQGSRTVLIKGARTYGGQILSVTASAPREALYNITSFNQDVYVGVKVTSDGNGNGGQLNLQLRGLSYNGEFWSEFAFVSASPNFVLDNTDFYNSGFYDYNVGENLIIPSSEIDGTEGKDIQATVTAVYADRNYGSEFNHQVLYDRFDRKVYTRIYNEDGTIENVDFNGEVYVQSELPEPTQFIEFQRLSSTELLFTYNNAPAIVSRLSATDDEGNDFPIAGFAIQSNSIKVTTQEIIDFGRQYTFTVEIRDVLGKLLQDTVLVTIPDPGGTGDNWGYDYTVWTGSPYFINEAYHVALYTASDLQVIGVGSGNTNIISRIGLPFHEVTGQGGLVTEEVINNGFVVAATIINYNGSTVNNTWVNQNLIVNGNFNSSILNVDNDRKSGITETVNGDRYVFFQLKENFEWNGSGNILVIYWMAGTNALNGGYNGGYIQKSMPGSQEVLGFSSTNSWQGSNGVVGEKAAIAFTTLRG